MGHQIWKVSDKYVTIKDFIFVVFVGVLVVVGWLLVVVWGKLVGLIILIMWLVVAGSVVLVVLARSEV